jgi:ABC-2 type transport system permease protein
VKRKGRNQFFTVLSFEFQNFMRNRIYTGITLAIMILLIVGLSIPTIIGIIRDSGLVRPDQPHVPLPEEAIYVIDKTGRVEQIDFLKQVMPNVLWAQASLGDLDGLKNKVSKQLAGGILIIEAPDRFTWIIRRIGVSNLTDQEKVRQALAFYFRSQIMAEQGLDSASIRAILAEPSLNVEETAAEAGKSMDQTYLYTYLLLFLLYMSVLMYGQLVATSVASEKSNRAMEMLITSAQPMSLMFGKVIGSGLAGLAQITVWLLTAGLAFLLNRASWNSIRFIRAVFEMPPAIVFFMLFFYLMGYFTYAFLYGALGSLASRTEDINTSIMPVLLLFIMAFLTSVLGMMSPDSTWLLICSFLPFFSPMTLFVRISMSIVPAWQIALSILIMLATVWATGWLAARIYRIGVLMYGKPPKMKELAKILRNSK